MLPDANVNAFDFSLFANGQQTMFHVGKYGRPLYPGDLAAAVRAGHLKPVLVAGMKLYYLPDVEVFAKKWAQRTVSRYEVTL
jgi:hypothetical protein